MSGDATNFSGLDGSGSGSGPVDELSSRVRLYDLPGHLRRSLADSFATWAVDRRPASLGQRIMARLTVDGSAAAMAAGLRGGAAVGRQLLFTTDLAEIALQIDDARDAATIDGQVLVLDGPDDVAIGAELWAADGTPRWADADESGSFVFDAVAPGSYRLVVTVGDDEIELGPLDVAAQG